MDDRDGEDLPAGGPGQGLDAALYQELRAIAHRQLLGERRDHIVCTTVLANDAYLKLARQADAQIRDRAHFLAVAATAMRRILVDYARSRKADKRGGREVIVTFEDAVGGGSATADDLLALHAVLSRLEAASERQARIVVYRVFGGLTEEECADVLGISAPTVRRDWRFARAWLTRELAGAGDLLGRAE